MIKVTPAFVPYEPDHGDLVCGFEQTGAEKYLETPLLSLPEGEVLPLCLIRPHPLKALDALEISWSHIKCPYLCPYTGYTYYSIMPAALVSTDLEGKWGALIRKPGVARHGHEYVLDHEFHRSMWKEKIFNLHDIGKAVLGLGYTSGTGINDGNSSIGQTVVNLDNGDKLWVYFHEWHNK